jgi:hypothetical protein
MTIDQVHHHLPKWSGEERETEAIATPTATPVATTTTILKITMSHTQETFTNLSNNCGLPYEL